jgi:hypothetical protein
MARIAERYPVGRWQIVSLIRWFSILGAVSAGVGLLLLARHLADLQSLIEVGLAVLTLACLWEGRRLELRRGMIRVGNALQLLGAAALQGFSFAIALRFSSGSENWPAVLGVDCLLLLGLAYALGNRLILIYAAVNFYLWFGGSTGYVSGWGVYWLGMTYPIRFLGAGAFALVVAYLHYRLVTGVYQSFSRVYFHFGLLITHLALWFLSLFGIFEESVLWSEAIGERLIFSMLWAIVSGACFLGAVRSGLGLLRGYGLTFLIINLYTFYFQFVVTHSTEMWFLHLLLVGGSMVALGMRVERLRGVSNFCKG